MTVREFMTRRNALLVLVFFVLVSGITFAVVDKDEAKPTQQPTTSEHDHSSHSHEEEKKNEQVAGATTETQTTTTSTSTSTQTSTKPAAQTASATTTPAATQPTVPANTTPTTEPTAPVEEEPEVPVEEEEEIPAVIEVPVGGNSPSYVLEVEGDPLCWYSFYPASYSDDQPPFGDKVYADVYTVLEHDAPMMPGDCHFSTSLQFHVRATENAVPGDDHEVGFVILDPATGEYVVHYIDVVVVENGHVL